MQKLDKRMLYTGKGEICGILSLLSNHIHLYQVYDKERASKEKVWLEKF